MEQLTLWPPEELLSLTAKANPSKNQRNPSESPSSCLEQQQCASPKGSQQQGCIRSTPSKDAAHLRMQLWASKTVGRNTSGKSELVPVGEKGDRIGQYHHRAVWTDAEIDSVFALADQGMTVSEIARKMEMPRSTVWAVVHGFLRGKTPSAWRRRDV